MLDSYLYAHLLLLTMPKVEWAGKQVAIFLNYTTAGSTFVYGYLADVSFANVLFSLALFLIS